MKRYLAFGGQVYYPMGGMNDLIGSYDTIEETWKAIADAKNERYSPDTYDPEEQNEYSWFQIWDIQENKIIDEKRP